MKHDKDKSNDFEEVIANLSPMFSLIGDQLECLGTLMSACHEPISDDIELSKRMLLIDELYSLADTENHAAAIFAEAIAEKVHEYESETVLIPASSQAEALSFLMEEKNVKQKDLSEIATQSVISEILNGKRKMTINHVKKLSEFFQVPIEFFLNEHSN